MVHQAFAVFDLHLWSPPAHGDEAPHLRSVLGLLLSVAFEPAVRSLRTIDDLSLCLDIQRSVDVPRVARTPFSDDLTKFNPASLDPLIRALKSQLSQLHRFDPHTAQLVGKILGGDGSWFKLAG